MTDVEFVFRQDVRDKKRTARGAFGKKNGSRSKKCTLPSEYLTRKERKKLNSEVKTWSMSHFYRLDEFKEMPNNIKITYLNRMLDTYDISVKVIAEEMFGISYGYFRKLLIQADIYDKVHLRNGMRVKQESVNRFRADFIKEKCPEDSEQVNTPEIEEEAAPEQECGVIKSAMLRLDGFDMETLEFLKRKYDGKKIEVMVTVCLVD